MVLLNFEILNYYDTIAYYYSYFYSYYYLKKKKKHFFVCANQFTKTQFLDTNFKNN